MAVGLQQQHAANPELSRFALGLEKKIAGSGKEDDEDVNSTTSIFHATNCCPQFWSWLGHPAQAWSDNPSYNTNFSTKWMIQPCSTLHYRITEASKSKRKSQIFHPHCLETGDYKASDCIISGPSSGIFLASRIKMNSSGKRRFFWANS